MQWLMSDLEVAQANAHTPFAPDSNLIDYFSGDICKFWFERPLESTKAPFAKCLRALLVVSGKVQSIFISTRLVNLYSNLGDVSLSRYTFDQIPQKDIYA